MADDAQDKQHLPTGKRLADLRKQGTVLRSRDLSGGLIFAMAVIILLFSSSHFLSVLKDNFIMSFGSIRLVLHEPDYFDNLIHSLAIKNFNLLLPLFGALIATAFLAPLLFGGWNFTLDVLKFNFGKLNPIENLKKLLSIKHTGAEVLRSVFKASFILSVLMVYFYINKNTIVDLINTPGKSALILSAVLVKQFIIILCCSLVVTVLFDMVYHFIQFQSKSKMSTQEIKDETKETEGDVQTKRRIRSAQFALLKQKLQQTVPRATVVITNPTHYAVALEYDNNKDHAPKLLAKGKGPLAARIRQLAIANGIPLYEAPTLARAIFFTTNLNAEIHPALYMSVAIVLSYVYQLKNYQMGVSKQLPNYVSDLQVPNEFIYQDND